MPARDDAEMMPAPLEPTPNTFDGADPGGVLLMSRLGPPGLLGRGGGAHLRPASPGVGGDGPAVPPGSMGPPLSHGLLPLLSVLILPITENTLLYEAFLPAPTPKGGLNVLGPGPDNGLFTLFMPSGGM